MLGSPAGPGGASQRGLWPLAAAPAPSATSFTDGFGKCGLYSLFPGGPSFGSALYSHASTIGRFASGLQPSSGNPFHATHKDSLYSAGYTFGAPTPPPGSPYSPVPVTQLELLAKGFNSNIIIQQQHQQLLHADYPPISPIRKIPSFDNKRCDEKCCNSLKQQQKNCNCQLSPTTTARTTPTITPPPSVGAIKSNKNDSGCSRTNPIEWNGVNVKKEPGSTPCQVAEISTSNVSPVVKLEVTSPKNSDRHNGDPSFGTDGNGHIPIGITVARQRFQQEMLGSPSLPPVGLLTTVNAANQMKDVARISEIESTTGAAGMAASTTGGGAGGGTILQCNEDRNSGLASWPIGGAHSSTINTPTLWQYPASIPMEPMVPMPPVGFQLVRDPTTGGLLLLPTTGIEPFQQAVVWPSYHQSSPVLLPPLPPPPLQLLSSASSDYLSTSTTLHQHTQTHSTRLVVTTDNKRKIPLPIPATTLIKIETDALDQTKTLQAVSTIANGNGTVFAEQNTPLVTTHVIYQPNLILPHQPQPPTTANSETICRSQGTSPVSCLTPPPEGLDETIQQPPLQQIPQLHTVQDASNQTESLIVEDEKEEKSASTTPVPEIQQKVEEIIDERVDERREEPMPQIIEERPAKPDLSGLELLSNSIVEYENNRHEPNVINGIATMTLEDETIQKDMGGLDILCALAEQRIQEEKDQNKEREHRKEKRKKKHSSDEPKKKKIKICQCQESYRSYKTPESEEEVKKFIASKQKTCKGEWPCMNAMELDMRMKLADLQRQYREKQKELSKLKPKKDVKKRSRKRSTHSDRSTPPPPVLDKIEISPKRNNHQELLRPPTLCAETVKLPKIEEIKQEEESSPEKNSSSKKRKVGRPKKLMSPSGFHVTTETIVAKKPKNNFVGYLLAAKEKLQLQHKLYSESPPRFLDDSPMKFKNNNNYIDEVKSCKIRPKLKAEPTIKPYEDDEWEIEEQVKPMEEEIEEEAEVEEEKVEEIEEVKEEKPVEEPISECTLTAEHLGIDKLRVLTAMGGLFYAGHLNAVEPPDVYSITLDGERGNRPHIMSREEILRDAIVEVSPKSTEELKVGTRLCAYWSQQYRCLYPGSVAEPGTPNPALDSKFVAVEFDDGDSGRIAIEDIRLLPPNYPIMEYDPNPLLSLSKRRRRTNSTSTEETRRPQAQPTPNPLSPLPAPPVQQQEVEKENKDTNKPDVIDHKERKRLKKRKKDKLKQKLERKKKKHRCIDEFCKHKKHHKKHRKHKKHHHYEESVERLPPIEEAEEDALQETPTEAEPEDPEDEDFNPDDEVTMDDIIEATKTKKSNNKKIRDRQESCESRSKMSAFLPARQLWGWSGKGYKRPRAKGRSRKQFYKAIQRGKETITVGDSAVFLSTGRPDRPYIGRIEAMWETCGTMVVKVKWFYHPEETVGCPTNLKYPGALFESPHVDENDVQTISHKCEVLPLKDYTERLGDDPQRYATIYDNNDIYYLAGYYDPTTMTLKMQPEIPFSQTD